MSTQSSFEIPNAITGNPDYNDAFSLFNSQKYLHSPAKTNLLLLSKGVRDTSYLTSGVHLEYFKTITSILESTGSIPSNRAKYWKQKYMAEKLAGLIVIYKMQTEQALLRSSRNQLRNMSSLQKNLRLLNRKFQELLPKLKEDQQAAINRSSNKQSSLRGHGKNPSGARPQDVITFEESKRTSEPCPNPRCGHFFTMPLESLEDVKRKNKEAVTKYNERLRDHELNGEHKPHAVKSISPQIGCYCYQ